LRPAAIWQRALFVPGGRLNGIACALAHGPEIAPGAPDLLASPYSSGIHNLQLLL